MKILLRYLNKYIFFLLPETRCFSLKRFMYRLQGYYIGSNTQICSSARIYGSGDIVIGDNVWIGPEVMIVSSSFIKIENNVDIAPRVYIGTGSHIVGDKEERMAGTGIVKNVLIKKGSWIGSNVIIMPGVTIEEMTVVGAGAVVTKNFQAFSILAGVPAKIIKSSKKVSK
ncbi:acyltransferase [Psychroflexus salinarum]|uniref:Acyltransferase n=1 Tax=Psychroflexus salinarum TaxID=546024 RepID=A0ABW3GT29_9FLAO